MVQAHAVFRAAAAAAGVAAGVELLIVRAFVVPAGEAAEVFKHFGIEDGRADLIGAHGPLAEVDAAAAVAAEREILVGGLDQLAAGWAFEGFDFGGLGHQRFHGRSLRTILPYFRSVVEIYPAWCWMRRFSGGNPDISVRFPGLAKVTGYLPQGVGCLYPV